MHLTFEQQAEVLPGGTRLPKSQMRFLLRHEDSSGPSPSYVVVMYSEFGSAKVGNVWQK